MQIKDEKKETEDIKKILEYWYTMEFLNQDKAIIWNAADKAKAEEVIKRLINPRECFTKEGKKKREIDKLHIVCTCEENESIYEKLKQIAEKYQMTRWGEINIYIGKIKREVCIEKIASYLQVKDKRVESNIEKISLAGLQLGPDLRYTERSFSLSPVLWAMNQMKTFNGEESISKILSKRKYDTVVESYDCDLWAIDKDGKSSKEPKEGEKKQDRYKFDGKYIKEYTYAVTMQNLLEIKEKIHKDYIEETLQNLKVGPIGKDYDLEEGIWLDFTLYKNDDVWNKDDEVEEFPGLSRNYFCSDIQMVLDDADNLYHGSKMQKELAEFITYKCKEELWKDAKRVDLLHLEKDTEALQNKKDFLLWSMAPNRAPLGKWPGRYMPAFMQQMAINFAISDATPIFSVNGPPGTGKTTLLKEIIVHNVVERARILAEYEVPDDAFEDKEFEYGTVGETHAYIQDAKYYHVFKNKNINKFSTLVVSSNNAAVENITKELPMEAELIKALKEREDDSEEMKSSLKTIRELFSVDKNEEPVWLVKPEKMRWNRQKERAEKNNNGKPFDKTFPNCHNIYFTLYANNLFKKGAWGLVAAPLGKKSNIHSFYNNVLREIIFASGLYVTKKERNDNYTKERKAFIKQVAIVKQMQKALMKLYEVEKHHKFKTLQEDVKDMEIMKTVLCNEIAVKRDVQEKCKKELGNIKSEYASAQEIYAQNQELINDCTERIDAINEKIEKIEDKIKELSSKGWLKRLFMPKLAEDSKQKEASYRDEVKVLEKEKGIYIKDKEQYLDYSNGFKHKQETVLKQAKDIEEEIKRKTTEIEDLEKRLRNIEEKIAKYYAEIEEKLNNYKDLKNRAANAKDTEIYQWMDEMFVQNLLSEDIAVSTELHTTNPWFSAEYNRQREILFYRALKLHEAFILASVSCKENLKNLAVFWGEEKDNGKTIRMNNTDIKSSIGSLFQTLFLLVPVISTTFASVGSFLKHVGPNEIGTLIVDEAGQAVPQMAVGALYRSQKAIIVGDPKQIEPVVTDDLELLKKAYKKEPVESLYLQKNLSVQMFADGLNPYGTWMKDEMGNAEWVGCPLVVHRRCISPMFDISNELSYNYMMKQKTELPRKEVERGLVFQKSKWIDVKGNEMGNKNHFVEEQGKMVIEILKNAFRKGNKSSIYVISPFTTVVFGMRDAFEKYFKEQDRKNAYGFTKKEDQPDKWAENNIGTVHTFQGKEANEVILLLGCDTKKDSEGAIKWVNKNIINVAVTRAKYRLYVIGDVDAWKKSEVLELVSESLIIETKADCLRLMNN